MVGLVRLQPLLPDLFVLVLHRTLELLARLQLTLVCLGLVDMELVIHLAINSGK